MPDPTVALWTRVKELEEEQQLHDFSIDAATARAEKAEVVAAEASGICNKLAKENRRLRDELWLCVKWLESRPDFTEGDAATSSSARGLLEGGDA